MLPSELIRTARLNLRELAWLAKTSSGTRALALTGAITEAERLLTEPDASFPDTVAALRTLVLWCHIGIDTPSRALGGLADRAEMFLTRTLGQAPVLDGLPSHAVVFTESDSADGPGVSAEITVGATEFTAAGETRAEALKALGAALNAQALLVQQALMQVTRTEPTDLADFAATSDRLRSACQPFYACVFNDNGDVTVTTTNLREQHWLALALAIDVSPDSRLRRKAKPFADCVIEADGQFTIDPSRLDPSDWLGIDRAYREVAFG